MYKDDGYYTPEELRELGIKEFGENVKISRQTVESSAAQLEDQPKGKPVYGQ